MVAHTFADLLPSEQGRQGVPTLRRDVPNDEHVLDNGGSTIERCVTSRARRVCQLCHEEDALPGMQALRGGGGTGIVNGAIV